MSDTNLDTRLAVPVLYDERASEYAAVRGEDLRYLGALGLLKKKVAGRILSDRRKDRFPDLYDGRGRLVEGVVPDTDRDDVNKRVDREIRGQAGMVLGSLVTSRFFVELPPNIEQLLEDVGPTPGISPEQ